MTPGLTPKERKERELLRVYSRAKGKKGTEEKEKTGEEGKEAEGKRK